MLDFSFYGVKVLLVIERPSVRDFTCSSFGMGGGRRRIRSKLMVTDGCGASVTGL
jgi:hypothetical protein